MGDKHVNQRWIAEVAARQHGVLSTDQLRVAGLSKHAIAGRVRNGRLIRIHRGVYAVGHAGLSSKGMWKAAVLACGEGSALSHRSAAELWGMLGPTGGAIHVTVPVAGGRARRAGIRIHRSPSLINAATTIRDGIVVTTPQRTLGDLKRVVEAGELRRAIRQSEMLELPIDASTLVPDRASSELELAFLRLCRRHRLPQPLVNQRVGRYVIDFLWQDARLIVETDGERFHRGFVAGAEDAARDRYLRRLGYRVLRFSYGEVTRGPKRVAARIRAELGRCDDLVAI